MCLEPFESNVIPFRRKAAPVLPRWDFTKSFLGGWPMGTMFAHVLNVPSTEMLVAGDAEMFFREHFKVVLFGEDYVYKHRNCVWEHMREEILRLSSDSRFWTLEQDWIRKHQLDCHFFDGSFAKELYGDGSDDSDEPDTLNSELLLTEEYIAPDASEEWQLGSSGPHYPVDLATHRLSRRNE